MSFGEPLPVHHQPHHHLLAVRAVVLRVAPFRLRVGQTLALKIAGRQVVEIDRAVQGEQLLFPFRQGRLDHRPFGVHAVQVPIERVVVHPAEVHPQDVRQRGVRAPVRHGMFRARGDQAVQGHQLGQSAGRFREPRPGQHFVYPQPKPELVADVDRPDLPGLLHRDSARPNHYRLLVGGRRCARFAGRRRRIQGRAALQQTKEGRRGTDERELAGLSSLDLARQARPLLRRSRWNASQ